jgi:lipopolysaccharide export system protein LptA
MLRTTLVFLLLLSGPALAQTSGVSLGGLRTDTNAPVEVTADSLSLDQTAATATFKGNVIVTQGEMRLTAAEILVAYIRQPDGQASSDIDTITASGGVTMVTPTEAAESQQAVYTPARNEVVMTGDVLLTQGPNTLNGQRLVVDLVTGSGQMEGRVRTILQPGSNQ